MAVTRRGYIFSAFLLSILGLLLILVAIASDSWIESTATAEFQFRDSTIRYGLFRGVFENYLISTPVISTLYVTCVPNMNACAVSCKTNREARLQEVEALANSYRPTPTCTSVTVVDTSNPLTIEPVIPFVFYVFLVLAVFLQLWFAGVAAALSVVNATKNPTEPVFGLPGCLWANVIAAFLGLTVLLIFGVYWGVSDLRDHLTFSFIALGFYVPDASLGYSYWLLIPAVAISLMNVGLIRLRAFLLEKDPPPSTLKMDEHNDGTIFLY